MATKSVEQRLADLEKKNEELEYKVERNEAAIECERLMGRYAYLHATHRMEDLYKLFAKDPGTRVYFGEQSYWEGPDAPKRAWGGMSDSTGEMDWTGLLFFHPNECPYIEVAKDLKTARGVWITDGMETFRNENAGHLEPQWA